MLNVRTPDEDFGILLEAAVLYDRRVAAILNEDDSIKEDVLWDEMFDGKQTIYPRLLFVITGAWCLDILMLSSLALEAGCGMDI